MPHCNLFARSSTLKLHFHSLTFSCALAHVKYVNTFPRRAPITSFNISSLPIYPFADEGGCQIGEPAGGVIGTQFKNVINSADPSRPITANGEWSIGSHDTMTNVVDVSTHRISSSCVAPIVVIDEMMMYCFYCNASCLRAIVFSCVPSASAGRDLQLQLRGVQSISFYAPVQAHYGR